MKKRFLCIWFLMIPIVLFSQSNEREKLIDEIATNVINNQFFTFYQQTVFAGLSEDKPSTYDNLAYEMFMYNTAYELTRKQLAEQYQSYTDDEIKEIATFLNSEACKRMNSNELQQEFVINFATAILSNAITNQLYRTDVFSASDFKIKDKEFTKLCNEYFDKLMPSEETMIETTKKYIESSASSGTKLPTNKELRKMGIFDLMIPIMIKATYKYVSLEQLKEFVSFYNSPLGEKMMKNGQNFLKNIYNSSTDGTSTSGIMSVLGINKEELAAKIEKHFNNYTIEDLKKHIEVRRNIKFEKIEPYKEIATIPYMKGTFTGETLYGVPDGYGTFTDKKGVKYTGTFANGKMHGRIVVRKEGSDSLVQMYALGKKMKVQSIGRRADGKVPTPPTYINATGEDVAMGYGFLQSDGATKIGFIIDGELQGEGEYYAKGNNVIQKGFFIDGEFVRGTEEIKYNDAKEIFTGTSQQLYLIHTIQEGNSITEYNDGSILEYKGRKIDYIFNGEGERKYIDPEGNIHKHKGHFAYGKPYGEGVTWKCNSTKTLISTYKGDIIADEFNGKGVLTITEKETENGSGCYFTIKDNNISIATYLPEITVIIEGDFKEGILTNGKITFSNGDWLEGKFKNGILVEGSCKINYATGKSSAIAISALKDIKIGEFYEGKIKYGKKNGEGILQISAVNMQTENKEYIRTEEGIFEDGVLIEGTIKNAKGKIIKTLKPKK